MELGSYRLIERLGLGGMGEVWRAEDTRLLRHVAIKILPAQLASDPEWKDRFLREARTIAQLNHPNIATIYAIGEEKESLFIAMELVEGESLATMIKRGPMMPADAVRVAAHVADGLYEAHLKGIIHRDVKPENIIVSPRSVKVLDFGIAKQVGGAADPNLTQGGIVLGTPHYMSPEQALGKALDARSDIFSLGTVLYEMLSGQKPFLGDTVTEVMIKIVTTEPDDIAIAAFGITTQLADIVRRAMQKHADARFATCDELRLALVESLKEDPTRKRQSQVPTITAQKKKEAVVEAPPTVVRPPVQPVQSTSAPASQPRGPQRALVADDDPAARYLIASVLTRHQIPFDEAANGADAVKLLKIHDYTLVFVDLLMPRLDGWGVIDYLRARRGGRNPRLYVVTGVRDQKLSVADQDVVSGLLYKPIDIDHVERLVTAT
ncbi:MAG TPA: protein kinase [Thermoanaerobaculia bacterium]|nr:protein kinase [Thermoanaerobaculia bacterium]